MSFLPIEVVLKVVPYADKATLKALRQCCTLLEKVTTPFLFDELVAVPLLDSFQSLRGLASNPAIKTSVHSIRYDINTLDFIIDYARLRDETGADNTDEAAEREAGEPCKYIDVSRELYLKSKSQPALDKMLRLSEDDMFETEDASDVVELTTLIAEYPNVQHVAITSRGMHELTKSIKDWRIPLPRYFEKQFKHGSTDFSKALKVNRYLDCDIDKVSYRSMALLLAVSNHPHRIFEVQVDGYADYLFWHSNMDRHCDDKWESEALLNVRSLRFCFPKNEFDDDGEEEDEGDVNVPLQLLARFLSRNRIMTLLELMGQSDPLHVPISSLFARMAARNKFPPLQQLTLSQVAFYAPTVVEVLIEIAATLQSLILRSITFIHLIDVPWEEHCPVFFFMSLGKHLNLSMIDIAGDLMFANQDMEVRPGLHDPAYHEQLASAYWTASEEYQLGTIQHTEEGHVESVLPVEPSILTTKNKSPDLYDRFVHSILHKSDLPDELVLYDETCRITFFEEEEDDSSLSDDAAGVPPFNCGDSSWWMVLPV